MSEVVCLSRATGLLPLGDCKAVREESLKSSSPADPEPCRFFLESGASASRSCGDREVDIFCDGDKLDSKDAERVKCVCFCGAERG